MTAQGLQNTANVLPVFEVQAIDEIILQVIPDNIYKAFMRVACDI